MIGILIVDDELTVRQGIRTAIDWSSYDMQIIGEAKNGMEALVLAQNLEPDIVLTDIRMPIMDGLAFSKELKKILPGTKIVILTGFDDFAYAKQAISIQVDEYILKPFGTEELIELMLSLKNKIYSEQKTREHHIVKELIIEENLMLLQNKLIKSLIGKSYADYSNIKRNAHMVEINLDGPMYQVVLISIDNSYSVFDGMEPDEKETLNRKVLSACATAFKHPAKPNFSQISQGQYIGIINTDSPSKFHMMNCSSKLKMAIQHLHDMTVTMGIGNAYEEISGLIQSHTEAAFALKQRIYHGTNAVLHIQNMPAYEQKGTVSYPLGHEKSLLKAIKVKDTAHIKLYSEEIFTHIKNAQLSKDGLAQYFTRLILLIITTIEEMGVDLRDDQESNLNILAQIRRYDTIEDIKEWFQDVLNQLIPYIDEDDITQYNSITATTLLFMKENYHTKITINTLSEIAYVTPNYLSKVFKEQTNQNVMEWLHRYRIEKSKALLQDIQYKIGEIAVMVGYSDYKHFAYNFKKYTGQSLSTFRNNNI